MSNKVDERVVEIKFDNRDFESNVSTTMSTLDKLNEKLELNEATKGLNNVNDAAKRVDLSNVTASAESAGQSFSALEVMGITALANLTNAAVNFGKSLVSNIISPITSGGLQRALNIEQASFQLEGLGISKSDSNSYYTEVMDAVLGTAYSYDVAAKAASQLAASNIGVTESVKKLSDGTEVVTKTMNGDMTKALLGMAGVASMTGSDFDSISQIFTRVAGQGRVMANDLNSLASRGLNAAATLGQALGVSEAEVRDMVSKGQVSFEMFSNAMSDAFGAHAKDSTKMFTGAMEDAKAALARIGADFYGPVLTSARDALNAFTPFVDAIHEVAGSSTTGGIGLLTDNIEKLSNKLQVVLRVATYSMGAVGDSQNLASSTAMNAIEALSREEAIGKSTTEIIQDLANVWKVDFAEAERRINSGEVALYELNNTLQKTTGNYKKANEVSKIFTDTIQGVREEKLWTLVKISDAMGLSANANNEVLRRLATDGVNGLSILAKQMDKTEEEVQSMIDSGKLGFDDFSTAMKNAVAMGDLTQKEFDKAFKKIRTDFIVQGNEDLLDLVNNTYYFVDAIRQTGAALKTIFGFAAKTVTPFLRVAVTYGKIIFELTAAVAEGVAGVLRQFTGLESAGKGFFGMLNGFADSLIISDKTVNSLIDKINKFFNNLGPKIKETTKSMQEFGKYTLEIANSTIVPKLKETFSIFKKGVKNLITIAKQSGLLKTAFTVLSEKSGELSEKLPGIIKSFLESKTLTSILDRTNAGLKVLMAYIEAIYSKLVNSKLIQTIVKTISSITDSLNNGIVKIFNRLAENEVVVKVLDTLSAGLKRLGNAFTTLFNKLGISDLIIKVLDKLSAAINNLFSDKNINKGIDLLITGLSALFENLSKLFENLANSEAVAKFDEAIVNLIEHIEQLDGSSLANISSRVEKLFDGNWKTTGKNITEGLSQGVIGGAESVFEAIVSLATGLINTFNSILGINSPSKVFYMIGGFIIAGLVGGISGNMNQVTDIVTRLCETIVSKIEKLDPGALMVDALLGGALVALYNFSKAARSAVSPIANLGRTLDEVRYTIKALRATLNFQLSTLGIVNLGLALALVAHAISTLADIPEESVTTVIKLLAASTVALAGLLAATKLIGSTGVTDALVFLSIAATFASLARTIKVISGIGDAELEKATDALTLLWIFLLTLTAVSGFAGNKIGKIDDVIKSLGGVLIAVAAMFIGIGIAFLTISTAMKNISEINPERLTETYKVIAGMLLFVWGVMALATRNIKDVASLAGMFASIAAVFLSMSMSIKILASMSGSDIAKGELAILGMTALIAGLMLMTKYTSKRGKIGEMGKMFGGIAAVFLSMAVSVKIMSGIKWTSLIKAEAGIFVLGAIISRLILASKQAGGGQVDKVGKMMEGIGKALLMMSGAILVLSILNPGKMILASVAIGGLLGIVALIVKNAAVIENAKSVAASMAITIGVIAGSLFILGQMDTVKLGTVVVGLLAIMWSMYGIFALINKMQIEKGIYVKMGLMAGVLVLAAGAIGILLHQIGPENAHAALEVAGGIALVMGAMAAVMIAIGVAGALGTVAIPGLVAIGVVFALMAILLEVIAAKADYCQEIIDNAFPVLMSFADMIGEFIARIIEKKSESTANALANFAKNIEPLSESAEKVSAFANAIKPIKNLVGILEGNVASKLTDLGRGLKDFTNQIKGIESDDLVKLKTNLTGMLDALGESAKKTAGQTKKSAGDMKKNGEELAKSFSDSLGGTKSLKGVSDSADKIVDKVKKGTNNKSALADVKNTGLNYAKGFASGISSSNATAYVRDAASSLGSTATKELKKYGIVKSPSKLWKKIGGFYGQGFAIGIANSSEEVAAASKNLADRSTLSLRGVVSRINDLVSEGIDLTPTISPVLDMSGVTASAGQLNTLFSNDKALGVSASFNGQVSKLDIIGSALSSLKDDLLGKNHDTNTYIINGITYDDGTNISNAVGELVRDIRLERRA